MLEEVLGINYDVVNNKCPKDKPMVVHRGVVLANLSDHKTSNCANCKKTSLDSHDFFYRCKEGQTCNCDHELCRHCALIMCDPPVLKAKETFPFHKCEMTRRPASDKDMRHCYKKYEELWCCDAVNENIFPMAKGKCESGMKVERFHSQNIQGYCCDMCDFHICLKCALKYKNMPQEPAPKVEECKITCMADYDWNELGLSNMVKTILDGMPAYSKFEYKKLDEVDETQLEWRATVKKECQWGLEAY